VCQPVPDASQQEPGDAVKAFVGDNPGNPMYKFLLLSLLLLFTAAAQAAPDGEKLFQIQCSVCHGQDGRGGVGVPLSLPSFIDSVSDEYLKITIREGRPGRIMPSFTRLSDAQIGAIVAYMRGWSTQPAISRNTAPVNGDSEHGAQVFSQYCARCHGADGRGGKGTGVTFSRKRDLPIIAPALNNPGFLAAASDQMIKNTIIHGRAGTPMSPMLAAGLSEADVDDVVSYIRSFQQHQQTTAEKEVPPPALIADSPYSLDETVENIKQSIANQNFTLIRVDYLEHGLVPAGQENHKQVVVHFCNFGFLFKALAIDPRIGMFLPCRVTVVEKDGKVQILAMNPERLSSLFNNDELNSACKEMTGVYKTILEDSVL
jgi:cytochrome c oxidase cbb3-type subunit 3